MREDCKSMFSFIFQIGDMVRCGKTSVQAPERPMEPYVRVFFDSSFAPNGRGFNISFKQYEKGNNTVINQGGIHILEKNIILLV